MIPHGGTGVAGQNRIAGVSGERHYSMKRMTVIGVAGSLVLAGTLANALITDPSCKHNFSTTSWANGEICLPCHAPHKNQNAKTQLLWNHAPSAVTADAYTFYTSTTMDAAKPTVMENASRMCMSCHDGTTALDAFGSDGGSGMIISSFYNMGTDLSKDHPVSIIYTVGDKKLHGVDESSGIPGGTTIGADMLFNGKVECSSCHDVHNKYGVRGMLKKSNDGSALCLTCHAY